MGPAGAAMPTTKRRVFLKDAIVPFTFKRGQCFLCREPAVERIAGEPVCRMHLARVRAIAARAADRGVS